MSRKPIPGELSAEAVLNAFLREKGILLGLTKPNVSETTDGMIVIGKPNIIAVYETQVDKKKVN